MRLVKSSGGYSIAVYNPADVPSNSDASHAGDSANAEEAARRLLKENRVDFVTPADYSAGGDLDRIVHTIIDKIAAEVELARYV
jgi:hypothetical protein